MFWKYHGYTTCVKQVFKYFRLPYPHNMMKKYFLEKNHTPKPFWKFQFNDCLRHAMNLYKTHQQWMVACQPFLNFMKGITPSMFDTPTPVRSIINNFAVGHSKLKNVVEKLKYECKKSQGLFRCLRQLHDSNHLEMANVMVAANRPSWVGEYYPELLTIFVNKGTVAHT